MAASAGRSPFNNLGNIFSSAIERGAIAAEDGTRRVPGVVGNALSQILPQGVQSKFGRAGQAATIAQDPAALKRFAAQELLKKVLPAQARVAYEIAKRIPFKKEIIFVLVVLNLGIFIVIAQGVQSVVNNPISFFTENFDCITRGQDLLTCAGCKALTNEHGLDIEDIDCGAIIDASQGNQVAEL